MFRRVFVANRGEIAARITRGVQAVGAEAVVAAANDDLMSVACISANSVARLGASELVCIAHRFLSRVRERFGRQQIREET